MKYLKMEPKSKPSYWKDNWPLEIPIVKGKHYSEYDFYVRKIKPEIYTEMVEYLLSIAKGHKDIKIPIGFNSKNLKEGITIIEK